MSSNTVEIPSDKMVIRARAVEILKHLAELKQQEYDIKGQIEDEKHRLIELALQNHDVAHECLTVRGSSILRALRDKR